MLFLLAIQAQENWKYKHQFKGFFWGESPNKNYIILNSNTVNVIDPADKILFSFEEKYFSPEFSLDSKYIAYRKESGNFEMYDIKRSNKIWSKMTGKSYLHFSPKNDELVTISRYENRFVIRSMENGDSLFGGNCHSSYSGLKYSTTGSFFALTTEEGLIQVYDAKTKSVNWEIKLDKYTDDLIFSNNDSKLFIVNKGAWNKSQILVYDAITGEYISKFKYGYGIAGMNVDETLILVKNPSDEKIAYTINGKKIWSAYIKKPYLIKNKTKVIGKIYDKLNI